MESNDQEEYVQKLEQKLNELRAQRIKVDEANETLRKKLETYDLRGWQKNVQICLQKLMFSVF